MKKRTAFVWFLILMLTLGLAGTVQAQELEEGGKVLRAAVSFAYPSIDVHKEYYGWYTSIYGISETLFRLDESYGLQPALAEDAAAEDNTWTITLKDGAAFSDGCPLTADMVIRNLQRAFMKTMCAA